PRGVEKEALKQTHRYQVDNVVLPPQFVKFHSRIVKNDDRSWLQFVVEFRKFGCSQWHVRVEQSKIICLVSYLDLQAIGDAKCNDFTQTFLFNIPNCNFGDLMTLLDC